MRRLIPHWLATFTLRRRHARARRKIAVIESMGLPEDLKLAAIARVHRRLEERLDRFTADV